MNTVQPSKDGHGDPTPAKRGFGGWAGSRAFSILWCFVAAFGTYACMYGFRKPYAAANFTAEPFTTNSKTWLIVAQVIGYTISKFIGIRFIAGLAPERRVISLAGSIAFAEAALLLFAIVPAPWNTACLFLNGLPLGLVFGLVLGFLEGRKLTEAFVAGLCASFIIADGLAKSVGVFLLEHGVTERWMPFTAGLIFVGPLGLFTWMLSRVRPPSPEDIESRAERIPMSQTDRSEWYARHGTGIVWISVAYMLITILRSMRADFAPEIWRALGVAPAAGLLSRSELVVAFSVVIANGLVVVVGDHRRAFFSALAISIGGLALGGASLAALGLDLLDGFPFMILFGIGLYIPYIAVHTTIFERLIALTRQRGNAGFLMYLADSAGYLGYAVFILAKLVVRPDGDFIRFFYFVGAFLVALATLAFVIAWWDFCQRHPKSSHRQPLGTPVPGR